MLKLRADEHRYLVTATGVDEALVRGIPGCRFVASLHAHQLPRQPGAILALDHVFGASGWEHSSELAQEVGEVRSRRVDAAQHAATVTLVGNELSVECAFGDKELVKLVPGYRWSAPQRRWFVPASPMALDLLQGHFGSHLAVDAEAATNLNLKRRDEDAAVERARRAEAATQAEPAPPESPFTKPVMPYERSSAVGEASDGLRNFSLAQARSETDMPGATLERLTNAIVSLESAIALLIERLPSAIGPVSAPPAEPERTEPATPVTTTTGTDGTWRELLVLIDADPEEALSRINPQLQLAGDEELPALRALAGMASSLVGEHESALTCLRKAEEHSAVPLEPDLQRRTREAYRNSVFALITTACEPQRPIASLEGLEELVLAELVHDSGFDDGNLAGRPALELLSFLMDDAHLRSFDAVLSDHCRVLHLLSVARGGKLDGRRACHRDASAPRTHG